MIERVTMQSSTIAAITYDSDTEILVVEFIKNNSVYQYLNISQHTFDEFKNSSSPGRFLDSQIKGQHPYEKIG